MTESFFNYQVSDRKSFIEFIKLLNEDFIKNPAQWENNTLSDFLEAIGAYANDIQGYYDNSKQDINADDPTWQLFADIFKGATMYE